MRTSSLTAMTFAAGLAWAANASAQAPAGSAPPASSAPAAPPPAAQPDTSSAPPVVPPPGPLPSEVPPPPPAIDDQAPRIDQPPPGPRQEDPVFVPALPPSFSGIDGSAHARPLDLMMPFSVATLGLGGLLILTGGITMGAGGPGEYCGITGCVDRPDPLSKNIGASMIGAGIGFASVGAFGLLGWGVNAPDPGEHRKNEPMAMSGLVLTSLSAASLGLGFAQMVTYDDRQIDLSTAWPFFVASGVLAGVGIPLFAVGAKNKPDRPPPAEARPGSPHAPHAPQTGPGFPPSFPDDPAAPKAMRSQPMMIAGGVLVGMGGLHAAIGTGMIIGDLGADGANFDGFLALLVGAPLIIDSMILTSVGIPLLAVGSSRDRSGDAAASALIPTITAGAGGIRTTWSLE